VGRDTVQIYAIDDENVSGNSGLYIFDNLQTSITERSDEIPKTHHLLQNYPNPFNSTTTISYQVIKSTQMRLQIVDVLGKVVQVCQEGYQNAGDYKIAWRAANLPSGIYFIKLETPDFSRVRKCLYLK